MRRRAAALALVAAGISLSIGTSGSRVAAQAAAERVPTATLIPATTHDLPSPTDSNNPAVWELVGGRPRLFVMTSVGGWPTRNAGTQLSTLANLGPVLFEDAAPVHGVWFEAIVPDVGGTWYGFYHNELPAEICDDERRVIPRIGAARSRDFGRSWEDLGVILEAPPNSHNCDSTNAYFVGGVGDFSVMLDPDQRYLYFFFTQYVEREQTQGVSVGRYPWADRDEPVGRMSVWWRGSAWVPARRVRGEMGTSRFVYSGGRPIYRVVDGWHDDAVVDAFWGPSVHWNTYLEQYVMLLNHAQSTAFEQDGIYISFSKSLSDPTAWSTPRRLIAGGRWYPQVIGVGIGSGTDRLAGERARFYMSGRSQYLIQFSR